MKTVIFYFFYTQFSHEVCASYNMMLLDREDNERKSTNNITRFSRRIWKAINKIHDKKRSKLKAASICFDIIFKVCVRNLILL